MNNMDGFDSMTMSYLGDPIPVGLLPHTDYLQTQSGMDIQDHLSNFDTEAYMRSEVARAMDDEYHTDEVPAPMT